MRLEIRSFAGAGDLQRERIILKALTDINVGDFALLKSSVGSSGRQPTSGRKAAYWFPDEKIKAGDLVILYTKNGSRSTKQLEGEQMAYFFYWKKDEPIWEDDQSGAVLLEVADWQFKSPLL